MNEFETVEAPVDGGLSQAAPQAMPAPAPAPAAPQPSEYQKAMEAYQRQKQELMSQQQRLIQSLEQRVAGPQDLLWNLAAAFAAPTRGGSFGESFGNAVQAMGQHSAQQRQQMSDIAKMRAEMAAQQLGMAKENVELARTRESARGLQQMIAGAPGSAQGAASQGERPAIPPSIATSIQNRLSVGDIKGAQELYDKYVLDVEKKPEKVRELEYYLGQLESPAAKAAAQQLAASNYFMGSPSDRSKAILEIRKAVDEGVMPAKDGNILIQGLTGFGSQQAAPAPSAAPAAAPLASPAGFPRVSPEEQAQRDKDAQVIRDREQTGAGIPTAAVTGVSPRQARDIAAKASEVSVTKRAESAEARREELQQKSEKASRIISDANSVFDLATKQPAAFGILSKPGISSALLTLVQNGIRVGNFSVGLNDVQDAIRKAGGTQADIDAAAAVAQIAVQTSLDLAAGVKGSVSNYEQGLFQQASFTANDSPAVLKYKAELARARGEFDKFIWNKYRQFEKSSGRGIEDFKETNDYRNYVKQYESALSKIRSTYFR